MLLLVPAGNTKEGNCRFVALEWTEPYHLCYLERSPWAGVGEEGRWFGSPTCALFGGQEYAGSTLVPAEVELPSWFGLGLTLPTTVATAMLLQHHQPQQKSMCAGTQCSGFPVLGGGGETLWVTLDTSISREKR